MQIWKHKDTKKIANIQLGHVVADVSSPHGLIEKDILVSFGTNGLLRWVLFLIISSNIDNAIK